MRTTRSIALLTLLAAVAIAPASSLAAGGPSRVTGGGSILFAGIIPMQFGFSAIALPNGDAVGSFHHAYTDDVGDYLFIGTVTCVTFDAANGRAWIGGVLTEVITNDPNVGIVPGDDAWFRVLDGPEGDRSTAMGFIPSFPSSAEYCAGQPWPDGNLRTHPVTEGQITVTAN